MKRINLQCVYDVSDRYPWVAVNNDGTVMGFENAPIRDFKLGMWQDCVTGSYGEPIPFDNWSKSVREIAIMKDLSKTNTHIARIKKLERMKNGAKS